MAFSARQLEQDPAAFPALEPEIQRCFAQFADRVAASLLAHAARQPALHQAAQSYGIWAGSGVSQQESNLPS
jgi:hypothetical protein